MLNHQSRRLTGEQVGLMMLASTRTFQKILSSFRRDGTVYIYIYGKFFMDWYSGKLLEQGHKLLASAKAIFQGTGAKLSGKVAGIYWHYNTRSNAAELTDGYYKFTTQ